MSFIMLTSGLALSIFHLRSTRFPMAPISLSSFSRPPSVVPSPCLQLYRRILLPRRTLSCSSSTSISSASITSSSTSAPEVVVTRERGKNGKLVNALVSSRSLALSPSFYWFCNLRMFCSDCWFIFWFLEPFVLPCSHSPVWFSFC